MKRIKTILFAIAAMHIYFPVFAQGKYMDLSPIKTQVGTTIIDAVTIVCFLFFIVGIIGAAWSAIKDQQEGLKGFILVIALTAIIGGGAYVAKIAFLG